MLTPEDIERCERTDEHAHHTHGTKFCPGVIFGPPDMGQRALPQPRRPWPFRSSDYEAGYDAGYDACLNGAHGVITWPCELTEEDVRQLATSWRAGRPEDTA